MHHTDVDPASVESCGNAPERIVPVFDVGFLEECEWGGSPQG